MLETFKGHLLKYTKLSPEEMSSRGILGRLVGPMCNTKDGTRNGRLYRKEAWEKAMADPIFLEKLENKCILGELEHPMDGRTQIDPRQACACLAEMPKLSDDGFIYGVWDIINTPNGQILKTLCDYGTKIGISSRGEGDIIDGFDGDEVDPDSFSLETFDFVLLPAVKEARLQHVTESIGNHKSLRESLQEAVDNADEAYKGQMQETIDRLFKDDAALRLKEAVYEESEENKEPMRLVKTHNSPVSSTELADELDGRGISYKFGDTGLFVEKKDYDIVLSILMQAEEELEDLDESIDLDLIDGVVSDLNNALAELGSVYGYDDGEDAVDEIGFLYTNAKNHVYMLPDFDKVEISVGKLRRLIDKYGAENVVKHIFDGKELKESKTVTEKLSKNANMVAKEFNYTMHFGNASNAIEAAVVIIPDGIIFEDGSTTDATVYCEDEDGNEINFKTVEEAQNYIDKYGDNCRFEIKNRDELHAIPNVVKNEECNNPSDCTDNTVVKEGTVDVVDNKSQALSELQEAMKLQKELKASTITLQNELAVSDAKVTELTEELEKYKSLTIKLGDIAKDSKKEVKSLHEKINKDVVSHRAEISSLKESLQKKDSTSANLNESIAKQKDEVVALKNDKAKLAESLNKTKGELTEAKSKVSSLSEEIEELKVENKIKLEGYSKDLEKANKLVEAYKKAANETMNRYIESKAKMLGVTKQEIRNKLGSTYTVSDVENVCEDLRKYKLNISKLPFDVANSRLKFTESRNDNLRIENLADEIDDQLISMVKNLR